MECINCDISGIFNLKKIYFNFQKTETPESIVFHSKIYSLKTAFTSTGLWKYLKSLKITLCKAEV